MKKGVGKMTLRAVAISIKAGMKRRSNHILV